MIHKLANSFSEALISTNDGSTWGADQSFMDFWQCIEPRNSNPGRV